MIIFSKIRVKNFLSYGGAWTEIDFLATKTTLISGKSGSGKSAINLDAVCFALFNKAYRNISKPDLLNDINGKQLEVDLYFSSKGKDYRVRRGIKPALFEIYENSELVDQSANNVDYQDYLEQIVLGMTYKTFTQIAVIGSANYKPFMQLSAANRREVIEDLLNIKVFSTMNQLLKVQVSDNKKLLTTVENDLTLSVDRATIQKSYVKTLQNDNTQRLLEIDDTIEQKTASATEKKTQLAVLVADLERDKQNPVSAFDTMKHSDIKVQITTKERLIATTQKKLSDIEKYVICSECGTPIDKKHHSNHVLNYNETIATITDELKALRGALEASQSDFDKYNQFQSAIAKKSEIIKDLEREIHYTNQSIATARQDRKKYEVSANIDDELAKLKDLSKIVVRNMDSKAATAIEKSYLDAMTILLKDSGIKSTIIKQYIPVINALVNKYLEVLDLFVSFELDENFEESIKAKQRDDRKYDSFSEGEKQRIDLALLFAWREIATMNNSMDCNILVMDEIFDKSLDSDGIDNALNILATIDARTNVFVISHRGEALEVNFDRHIQVSKVNNYSILSYE